MKRIPASPKQPILAALLFSLALSARADIIVFTDESLFLSVLSGSAVDSFDDLLPDELGSPLPRLADAYRYQVSTGPGDGGFFPVLNGSDVYLAPTLAADVVTFSGFGPGVFGFGGSFFATDAYGGYIPDRSIELTAMNGTDIATYTMTGSSPSSFLGFLSSSRLTEIAMRTTNEQGNVYWATANNVVVAVPEPSTYSMFGAGIAMLAARRRRHASRT